MDGAQMQSGTSTRTRSRRSTHLLVHRTADSRKSVDSVRFVNSLANRRMSSPFSFNSMMSFESRTITRHATVVAPPVTTASGVAVKRWTATPGMRRGHLSLEAACVRVVVDRLHRSPPGLNGVHT